ncbi:MAG: TraR/DksA family transcriptional regulator [Flavipsychrobacter sp.]|nr:TraR/DksA family transcriptional regulator [Flavipsychrobacter sp.]
MAIKNKKAATPANSSKNKPAAKKAAVAVKKAAPSKSKPITKKAPSKPVAKKNVVTKPAAKKAAPAKAKPAPVKKAAPKPAPAKPQLKKPQAKKNVSAPKSDPKKKSATNHNQQTVNKKTSKPAEKATKPTSGKKPAPAKKAEPAKKAVAVKKAAPPAKKAAPVTKKAVAAKPAPAAKSAPKAAPAPAKKAAPAPVKAAPAPAKKAAPAPVAKPAAKPVAKKAIPAKALPVKPLVPTPKPTATPAARPIEKKPTVIIAHRKLENKSKVKETNVSSPSYQAETYRSILDEPELPQQSTVYRYSDEELAEFKQIIVTRLDAARKELHYLQGLITRKDEAGTEDTENRFMNMEDGSGAMEREQLAQLASRQIQFMNHLEKALVRIENKTYGVCRVTGKLIDKARLRAVPHATLSIEAKNMLSSKHN